MYKEEKLKNYCIKRLKNYQADWPLGIEATAEKIDELKRLFPYLNFIPFPEDQYYDETKALEKDGKICNCNCHDVPGIRHILPCCSFAYLQKISQ